MGSYIHRYHCHKVQTLLQLRPLSGIKDITFYFVIDWNTR
jgi:hypothetical protein